MAYAITLNTEILNQTGVPVKHIVSHTDGEPQCDGQFYSFGDIILRVDLVEAIVKMNLVETDNALPPVNVGLDMNTKDHYHTTSRTLQKILQEGL